MAENEQRKDVNRLLHEYLTVSMIMARLDKPRSPDEQVGDVLAYLDKEGFDLAVVQSDELRVVYRDKLKRVATEKPSVKVLSLAESPQSDRIVGRDLELIEVARRLQKRPTPILVVGRNGPDHIATRSDFMRPAGQAGILAVLTALDAHLDVRLQRRDADVWPRLAERCQKRIKKLADKAKKRNEELPQLAYLFFSERLALASQLRIIALPESDQTRLIDARNDLAHGRTINDGMAGIEALMIAYQLLNALQ